MKKILYVVTKSVMGGAQKMVFDLTCEFKNKYEVSVCAGGSGELFSQLKKEGVRVLSLSNMKRDLSAKKDVSSFFALFNIIKKEKPDILHLHSPKAGGFGALIGRLLGVKKIIYTSHGWTFNEDRPFIQKTLIKIFSWIIVILSHKTIVLSQSEKKIVSKWLFVKNKLEIIPVGIKPFDTLEKTEARKKISEIIKADIQENEILIGTIAELHKNKGLIYAIKAVKKIPNLLYLIIGSGELEEELKIEASASENIYFCGNIPEAKQLLKAFDVFLLPSIKEGLPYVLLESGLAEIPIIATDVGGIKELIENDGIIIKPKNPEEISQSINKILSNKNSLSEKTKRLSNKIKEKYSLGYVTNKIENLYNS